MSRKRNNLSQSISSLSASIPDIPVTGVGDHTDHIVDANEMIPVRSDNYVKPEGQSEDAVLATPQRVIGAPTTPLSKDSPWNAVIPAPSPTDLFTKWSLTPEGHRVRDSRVPTDPVRLGCILDDNARIAFLAGYAAATPSFE